jgi:hypothetical protein
MPSSVDGEFYELENRNSQYFCFIYGEFNDAVSRSDYIASNDRIR